MGQQTRRGDTGQRLRRQPAVGADPGPADGRDGRPRPRRKRPERRGLRKGGAGCRAWEDSPHTVWPSPVGRLDRRVSSLPHTAAFLRREELRSKRAALQTVAGASLQMRPPLLTTQIKAASPRQRRL